MAEKDDRQEIPAVSGVTTDVPPPTQAAPIARTAYAGLALGLALFTLLIGYQGAREVGGALVAAGPGLLLVAAFHLVPMLANAIGWRALFDAQRRLSVAAMLHARWIGESVNGLLPVLQVGGNVVKAQLVAARGIDGPTAGASVVVDVMLMVSTQIAFTLIGAALLVALAGGGQVVWSALIGAGTMGLLVAGFYMAQRRGLFGALARRLEGLFGAAGGQLAPSASALDAAVRVLYRRPSAIATGAAWHLASWVVGAGEVWLALRFLGHPVGIEQALLLESLGQAVRTAAFVVPGALGVQEGGYLVLGTSLGLAPETALALSLAKRVREIVLGVPGLVAWQAQALSSFARSGGRRS